MTKNFTQEQLIGYLQSQLNDFQENLKKYGAEDRIVDKKFDAMIACKGMVESLIDQPVNLQHDGKVTVGF
jgi:hypothetical protein